MTLATHQAGGTGERPPNPFRDTQPLAAWFLIGMTRDIKTISWEKKIAFVSKTDWLNKKSLLFEARNSRTRDRSPHLIG
jgi:hypothetical protein